MNLRITRLTIVFAVAFIIAIGALNYNIIKAGLGNASNNIFSNNDTELTRFTFPNVEPKLFPITTVVAIKNDPLPKEARLVINKLNVNVPIVMSVPNNNDAIFDALNGGVVVHPIGPKPGEKGISIILGHSSSIDPRHKYGTVFSYIDQLEVGDQFYVEYENKKQIYFEVQREFIYNPFDANDQELYAIENLTYDGIVLTTCWPRGTALKRRAVLAKEI